MPRTDTLNEVIFTILRNIPTNLTTAEKNAIIERLGLTASGEGGTELPPYLQSDEEVLHSRARSLYWDPINEVPIAGTVGHVLTKTGENDGEYAFRAPTGGGGGDTSGLDARITTNAGDISCLLYTSPSPRDS